MKKLSLVIILLGCIMVLAEIFRFSGINWDSNAHLHPDERFLTMVTTSISWPKTIAGYFQTDTSPLNPHNKGFAFYVYGTYPLYVTHIVANLFGQLTYNGVTLVGRKISVLIDLLTVFFVFLIGFHASGKRWGTGLIAALLYALAPLPIQLSHFYTVDPYVTLFSTVALYRIVRKKYGILLGIVVALAVGAKISAILLVCIVGYAYAVSFFQIRGAKHKAERWMILADALLCGIAFAITLHVVYPYLFEGFSLNQHVLDNWKELASFDGPTTSFPPGIQWIGVSFLQPLFDLTVWGFGLPEGVIMLATLCWQSIAIFTGKRKNLAVFPLLLWVLILLFYQSFKFAKPMRYFWALYPALAVLGALTVQDVLKRLSVRMRSAAMVAGLVVCIIPPIALLSIYLAPNTRVSATRWIFAHIPQKTSIGWEHWDDPLPFPLDNRDTSVYTQIQLPVFDPDSAKKWTGISTSLAASEYIVVSSNRGYGAIGRAEKRFPQTARYYRYLFSGILGYTIAEQFTSRPTLPLPGVLVCVRVPGFSYGWLGQTASQCAGRGVQFVDDYADETFTVYDHPIVTIFRNTGHRSKDELYRLLTAPL